MGDDFLKTVEAKVWWAEGAKQNDITLSYLLTDQKKIDTLLTQIGDVKQCLDPLKKKKVKYKAAKK